MEDRKPIALANPGKLGDFLYMLPTARYLCNLTGRTADIYSSEYCRATKRLVEYQSYVDGMYFSDKYKMLGIGCGLQPFYVPLDYHLYETVWQCGFRACPDRPLHLWIAMNAGIQDSNSIEIKYDYPDIPTPSENYFVLAARGNTSYKPLFLDVIKQSPIKVVQIGSKGEYIGEDREKSPDMTGLDMLETTTWIARSQGFVGIMSAMLVLANGFPINRVAPHDGIHWTMEHVVRSEYNFYPINPSADEILKLLHEQ